MVHLLCRTLCYQRSSTKPRQFQSRLQILQRSTATALNGACSRRIVRADTPISGAQKIHYQRLNRPTLVFAVHRYHLCQSLSLRLEPLLLLNATFFWTAKPRIAARSFLRFPFSSSTGLIRWVSDATRLLYRA
jgi:hypothetical protein